MPKQRITGLRRIGRWSENPRELSRQMREFEDNLYANLGSILGIVDGTGAHPIELPLRELLEIRGNATLRSAQDRNILQIDGGDSGGLADAVGLDGVDAEVDDDGELTVRASRNTIVVTVSTTQNPLNPAGIDTCDHVIVTPTTSVDILSLPAPTATGTRSKRITNNGLGVSLTLRYGVPLRCPSNTDYVLLTGASADLYYEDAGYWRVLGVYVPTPAPSVTSAEGFDGVDALLDSGVVIVASSRDTISTTVSSTQNPLNPAGMDTCDTVLVTPTTGVSITTIATPSADGTRLKRITNAGSANLTFTHGINLRCPSNANYTLTNGASAWVYYEDAGYWRVIGVYVVPGITDHGALSGLDDVDDHLGYILHSGLRTYTGHQSHGNFNVTDVGFLSMGPGGTVDMNDGTIRELYYIEGPSNESFDAGTTDDTDRRGTWNGAAVVIPDTSRNHLINYPIHVGSGVTPSGATNVNISLSDVAGHDMRGGSFQVRMRLFISPDNDADNNLGYGEERIYWFWRNDGSNVWTVYEWPDNGSGTVSPFQTWNPDFYMLSASMPSDTTLRLRFLGWAHDSNYLWICEFTGCGRG